MLISIVIPVYNGEKYIESCLQSLKWQTMNMWEAVFVDDGSTDNSLEILKNAAMKDYRIKIYSKENGGAAKAREFGITMATGEFITFLDIDDNFQKCALSVLYNAFDDETDIVVSGFNILKAGKLMNSQKYQQQTLLSLDYFRQIACGKSGWQLCGKMYRKKLFNRPVKTPGNIRCGEDMAVLIQLICYSRKVKVIENLIYNYIQYNESASHVKSPQYAEEMLQASFFADEFLKTQTFYSSVLTEISALYLLCFCSSIRKGLNYNSYYVKFISQKHFKLSALCKIPFYKAIYITYFLIFGRFMR